MSQSRLLLRLILQLVLLKRSKDNASLDCSAQITPSSNCSVFTHFVIRQDWSRSAGSQKHLFLAPRSQARSSVPSSALLCAGNPIFHKRGSCTRSFWVTKTTRFESVDTICQMGRLKKWLQAPLPLLSPVSSHYVFMFALSQFSGPDYLGAWNGLQFNNMWWQTTS